MSRYIDADKLINDLDYDVSCYPGGNDKSYIQVCDFKSMINGQPTADVVEVVRCKECKYLMFSDFYGECSKGYMGIVYPNGFCSHGERADMRGDKR